MIKIQFQVVVVFRCHMTVPTTGMGISVLGGLGWGHQKGPGLGGWAGAGSGSGEVLGLEASLLTAYNVCLPLATAVPLSFPVMVQPGSCRIRADHPGVSGPQLLPLTPGSSPQPTSGSGLPHPADASPSPEHPPAAC